jgi:hypothetical protein
MFSTEKIPRILNHRMIQGGGLISLLYLDRLSSCNAAKTRLGSATLPAPFSETPPGVELIHALDLNGENGSAGATFIVVNPEKKIRLVFFSWNESGRTVIVLVYRKTKFYKLVYQNAHPASKKLAKSLLVT